MGAVLDRQIRRAGGESKRRYHPFSDQAPRSVENNPKLGVSDF
jgi:hypothetical protein